MTKFLNKRNLYIGSFSFLYVIVAVVSLIHSFSFFGLANTTIMSVLLGIAFEIGQAVVLFSILSTKKEQSKIVPWVLMTVLTIVQVMGNIFASYKYIVTNSVADLQYFKDPIFIWTNLPDKMTTVIVTYIVGAILPIIALLMTSTLADFINGSDASLESPDDTIDVQPTTHNIGTIKTNVDNTKQSTTVESKGTVDNKRTNTDVNSVTNTVDTSTDSHNTVDNTDSDSAATTTDNDTVNVTSIDTTSTDSEVVDVVENKPEPNRFISI
nr:MAG TPA: hypothetical protein [Caudoviricetes sp.]